LAIDDGRTTRKNAGATAARKEQTAPISGAAMARLTAHRATLAEDASINQSVNMTKIKVTTTRTFIHQQGFGVVPELGGSIHLFSTAFSIMITIQHHHHHHRSCSLPVKRRRRQKRRKNNDKATRRRVRQSYHCYCCCPLEKDDDYNKGYGYD
jgi:hypothetical protein